jgi:hypothetical protein
MERLWLKPGDEPPGRWELDESLGLRTWRGPAAWSTRHGEAVIHWSLGRPNVVEGAMTPEGPMRIETASPVDRTTWRRRSAMLPGGFVHGEIEITNGGVAFTDLPPRLSAPPPKAEPGGMPDLASDLASDGAFLQRLQDTLFARAVYATLYNGSFRNVDHARRWSISGRGAGAVIAEMREIGETYIDFYLDSWTLGRTAAAHLARMGWKRLDPADLDADHRAAMEDIARAEARQAGPVPAWASEFTSHDRATPSGRTRMAASAGKLSRDEFDSILERLDFRAEEQASIDFLSSLMTDDDPPAPGP